MNTDSDTPETDAVLDQGYYNDDLVIACRRLERERDEARMIARNNQDFISGALGHPKIKLPWEDKP